MKLDLTDQEVDQICRAVSELPWRVADPLMQKILHQANNQAPDGPPPVPTAEVIEPK